MSHLVPALLLFLFTSPPNAQPVSLPDAPVAQAPTPSAPSTPTRTMPDPHWLNLDQLPPGKAIAVLERGRAYPSSCNIDLVNDTTLTCIQATPYSSSRRLIYPKGNIAAVFLEEIKFGPSLTAVLLGLGIGAGLGAGVCNEASARTILSCSLLGAGIGAGIALTPPPFPHPPRVRRRLIYRAP
jgi:hypothetical protein